MIFTVSSAADALRSTQNTEAPSRAKVTAVALPLPQPGPIEPAPTTIATLPLSRSIAVSLKCLLLRTAEIQAGSRGGNKPVRSGNKPRFLSSLLLAKPARQRPFHGED